MRVVRRWLISFALLSALLPVAHAQTWTGAGGDANVTTTGNWNPSGAPVNDSTATLSFPDTTFPSVSFNTAYSVSSLTFSGTTAYNLSGSTVSLATGISDSATTNISINTPLQLTGAATFTNSSASSGLNIFSAVTIFANNLSLSIPSAGEISVTGNITGSGALSVTGSGTNAVVFLSGTGNTYSGGTTINSGVLQIGDPGLTSSGSLPGNVTDNGQINFKPASGGYTYSGVISGSGNFVKLGPNTLTLGASSTYAGFSHIDQGTVQIGVDNALPTGTTLDMNGANSPVLNLANNQTINHFGSSDATGASITLASGKTLTVSPLSSSVNTSFAGTISGTGGLLVINGVSGSKVSLTGSNTFTGGTTVNGGQLGIHNTSGSALGTGAVVVNSGGKIEGGGSFTGSLTLNSGSTLVTDPKLSVGATTINGGTSFFWPISDANGVSGTALGLLSISGALALNASNANPITIKPVSFLGSSQGAAANFVPTSNYTWNLTSGASSLSGFAANEFTVDASAFTNPTSGTFSVGLSGSGNDLVLNYTASAIPEPSTYAAIFGALALGSATLLRRRVRRG